MKKATYKTQKFPILLVFLLITITCIFINYYNIIDAVNIYCYLIKCRAKQKYLLPFHITNNKIRELLH